MSNQGKTIALPGVNCRYFAQGRCLYDERLNPGWREDWECRVLVRWKREQDHVLARAEAFGLNETAAARLWSRRMRGSSLAPETCPDHVVNPDWVDFFTEAGDDGWDDGGAVDEAMLRSQESPSERLPNDESPGEESPREYSPDGQTPGEDSWDRDREQVLSGVERVMTDDTDEAWHGGHAMGDSSLLDAGLAAIVNCRLFVDGVCLRRLPRCAGVCRCFESRFDKSASGDPRK